MSASTAEHRRLDATATGRADWQRWGTYLSDRAWGTVREDYSAGGDAWGYFPHDHARSRAYRWGEDGIGGFCDRQQLLCLAVALWNERDPILKERMFGLANAEGNHGEDVKEYYFYLDNTPTHAYARMLYKYPQVAFPYAELVAEGARRSPRDPEYELFDAIGDAFRSGRYFDVVVEYAKADAEDILCRISAVNRGPEPAPIHVLPHLWYRNTWSWDVGTARPAIRARAPGCASTEHPALGERWWYVRRATGEPAALLFTENDTNRERLFAQPNATPFVKDGIHDAVVGGRWDRVNHEAGSKAAAHVHALVAPGSALVVHVRLSPRPRARPFAGFDALYERRRAEADAFHAAVHAPHLSADERLVQRQALAGLLWSKQFYHLDVYRWLSGDPTAPAPPASRWQGRNRDWIHLYIADVLLMPDPWEFPWFAAWDLAFHCVVMAMIDPAFAKAQLRLLLSPLLQHPYGAVPAYEWEFGNANPPVIAWAAWQVYQLDRAWRGDGRGDVAFLKTIFEPLVVLLAWWLNRKDSAGRGIFGGGFLGLDNIGVIDRDRPLPTGGTLEQSDATGWMAMFQLHMFEIALELSLHERRYFDMLFRFGQHFTLVANVLQHTAAGGVGLWDAEHAFYWDVIRLDETRTVPLRLFSIVGLVPLFAGIDIDADTFARVPELERLGEDAVTRRPYLRETLASWAEARQAEHRLLSVVHGERLRLILRRVLDESQFLSPYGVRSLSREHEARPFRFRVGNEEYEVRYQPGLADDRIFGGNSNWRGPVWFPMNFLLLQALDTFARHYGDTFTVECPTGSGRVRTLAQVGAELAGRLTRIFLRDGARDGRRAVFGDEEFFQRDPHWRDCIPFHEFFHGDTGRGLGASHQTGWTALVALLLQYGGALHFDTPWKVPPGEEPPSPGEIGPTHPG
ncbi:MAG TPA: hypothetical protein VF041_15025 [Gemmatimonadaceae bacterium]